MPRRKSAKTLKAICLNFVASNMDYWCADYEKNVRDRSVLYIVGPFDCLPPNLLLEVLDVLKKSKLMRRPYLDLLVSPGLDRLNISGNSYELSYILGLIGRVCKNLKYLDLSFCEKTSQNVLRELVCAIPQIVVLDLRRTGCTNAVLSVIGANCQALMELDVSWCQSITDSGISALCISVDEPNEIILRCQKLTVLSVIGTQVSQSGAICALKNLPHLRKFSCSNTCHALEVLHAQDIKNNTLDALQKYKLENLYSDCDFKSNVSEESIEIATVLCPHVSKVVISNANVLNHSLLLLSRFSNLTELEICNGIDTSLTFSESISPILQTRGSRLSKLTLAEIPEIDVMVIGCCCPELRQLHLLLIPSYTAAPLPESTIAFEHLDTLRLAGAEGKIPPAQLRLLLSHCHDLRDLYIRECDTLTDDVLTDILNSNTMPEVELVELECCNSITAASIMILLNLDNALSTLKMCWCQDIYRRDYEMFLELVEQENLDMTIEWM